MQAIVEHEVGSTLDALTIRLRLGRSKWAPPIPFGPDGYTFRRKDQTAMVLVTCAPHDDGIEWIHASISRPNTMPTYSDLVDLHRAVFGAGWAYQVFSPPVDHVNIHPFCLHLWGRLDGEPVLPNFGARGSI